MAVFPAVSRNIAEASVYLQYHRVLTTARFRNEQREINVPPELRFDGQKIADIQAKQAAKADKAAEAEKVSAATKAAKVTKAEQTAQATKATQEAETSKAAQSANQNDAANPPLASSSHDDPIGQNIDILI